MAASKKAVDDFLVLMANRGCVIVPEAPKFDLEPYIQNYSRASRYDRLILIGQSSVPLCIDALKAAHAIAKNGKNVAQYREVWEYLRVAAPNEPEAQFDEAWVKNTEAANAAETKRLERELKAYKNNLVKESIRMGHEDLGNHLEAIGDLNDAAEAYNRMRPDVSAPKHIVEVCKHLVRVSLQRHEWTMVLGHLNKMVGLQVGDEEKAIVPYLRTMAGVAMMGQEKYGRAAREFLEVGGSAAIGQLTDGQVTSNDVAVYGGLVALASMDRGELQTHVLDNPKFRPFLEMEPHIRRAISQFVNGRYKACLAILEAYRPDYMLDLFLHKHVQALYEKIRNKCIVQYLIPFSCVTLDNMNAAFAAPGQSIEDELISMVRQGLLNARIDTINKLVIKFKEDPRGKMQQDSIEAVTAFSRDAIDRLRRINVVAAELEIRGARRAPFNSMNIDMQGNYYEQLRSAD